MMSTRMQGKKGYMAIKLDMKKAYDRVEWPFVEAMIRRLGFAELWIRLIMKCVTLMSYSVLLNGSPLRLITPTRGLRQGDPLSPYLFLLCVEGLRSLLNGANAEGKITGVPILAKGFQLSHLFFADDSLIFCQANFQEWGNILLLLKQYELASGQKLNSAKTVIFYSRYTRREFRDFINSTIGISATVSYEKYLGDAQRFILLRGSGIELEKKPDGWKKRFLSQAYKEVLLKAAMQAIPTYGMSIFSLPKTLCKSLNSLMNHFWWGKPDRTKGVHWMSWSWLGMSKQCGGMGGSEI